MNKEILTFAGKNLADFKCYWDGSQVFRRTGREIEKFSVPGRSGDLTISKDRFPNVIIPYNCFIKDDYKKNYTELMDFLNNQKGYQELRSTEEANAYRLAIFHANTEPLTTPFNQAAQFTLEFDCDPRLFLDEGNQELQLQEAGFGDYKIKLFNPTYSPAFPLIKIETQNIAAEVLFSTGGYITIDAGANYPVYLDFSGGTVEAYDRNGLFINDKITIFETAMKYYMPGKKETTITVRNASATIKPRWYRL